MTNPQHEALVEAVARAIYLADNPSADRPTWESWVAHAEGRRLLADNVEHYRHFARAAIAALSATAATPSDEVVHEPIRTSDPTPFAASDKTKRKSEKVRIARAALEPQAKLK